MENSINIMTVVSAILPRPIQRSAINHQHHLIVMHQLLTFNILTHHMQSITIFDTPYLAF